MTNYVTMFFTAALTAMAVQNPVFARALGLNRTSLFLKSPRLGILYGGLLTVMATVSAVLVSGINHLLADSETIPFTRAPAYLLCVIAVYALTFWTSRRFAPTLHEAVRPALPICAFNTALFGALFVSANQEYGLAQTVGYALGSGIGYTIALLVIFYARKRLAISPIPRSFRGLPILMLYIGLLSLAIYGLIGHGLPI